MGGTLPLLARCVTRSADSLTGDLGRLYAANLAGGVAGSALAGFVLIRELGVQGATMVAVLGNLLVGIAALGLAGRAESGRPPDVAAAARAGLSRPLRRLLWVTVFVSGLVGLGYEVLWTR